jgi:hypothetical protein
MELLRGILLFPGFIPDTSDLTIDVQDFIILLFNQLFDSLKSFISLLHAEQRLLPVLKQSLLAHDDLFDFDGSLLESVPGCCCLLLLGNQLCLVQSLLLVKTLDLFIHSVYQ